MQNALTANQKSQLDAMGIDWKNLDWSKVISILQLIITLFGQSPPMARECHAACPDECCDKLQLHVDAVHASACALGKAVDCYNACCAECE